MQDGNFSVDQNLKWYDFLEKTVFPKHVRFTGLPVSYSFYSLKNQLCTLIPSDILDSSDHVLVEVAP